MVSSRPPEAKILSGERPPSRKYGVTPKKSVRENLFCTALVVFVGPGGQRWAKWSQVVASGVRALEGFGRRAKHVPGPSQTGRGPYESRRSNSTADFLPRCRATLAFAGLLRGRPLHSGARREPRKRAVRVLGSADRVPHRARQRVAARDGACGQPLSLPGGSRASRAIRTPGTSRACGTWHAANA